MQKKLFNKGEYTFRRKKLRHSMTKSETVLWMCLKGQQLGWKFRRQHGIGPYVADFFCPELKLAIDIDGISHEGAQRVLHDQRRDVYFKQQEIRILRFTTEEIMRERDRVLENIYQECKKLTSLRH